MSSKGRKIAKNLGKSLRKKFDSDSQNDDLQQRVGELNLSRSSPTHCTSGGSEMRSSGNSASSPGVVGKSTSLSTIGSEQGESVVVDHSEIIALTHDVKNFSDTLAKLKILFIEGLEPGDDARVISHESLGEVLAVLKGTLQRYSALQSPEIFTAARVLISKIKSHNYEEELDEEDLQLFLEAIDQLALSFSRSVSEYLMGDIVTQQQLAPETKVRSCDNIAKAAQEEEQAEAKAQSKKAMTPAELDAVMVGLEAGLDLALQRAKAWSRYTRDIISYIEKKSQLELEYAKSLSRIAHSMQPVLTNEGFLPLQSVFCTSLSQDAEFASNLQASHAVLHTSKFVEPLSQRRAEHDRVRKAVKETWDREVRRMQDTVNNLRKAQAMYISRQQEYERAREAVQKSDGEKLEKRKKLEEEAMHKAAEAETTYKACVAEANHRQRALEKTKAEQLAKLREQIQLCDQAIKTVAVEYFSLLHTVWSPVPVQYQTLSESSSNYETGCQYAEFIKRLPSSASKPCRTEEFTFEPYTPGQKPGEARKISVHSNGSSGEHVHSNEGSPVASPRRDKYRSPVRAWGQTGQPMPQAGSDTDSASGSTKSHESSPSSSPHNLLRRQMVSSQSLDELAEEEMDRTPVQEKRGQMKRTMTVGGEETLELPGLLNQHGRRNTMFGVDFQEQVERYKSQVPPIITKCLAEIERRGVMIKGIYRVSGVKSKVESLCQRFDLNPELVDLEEVHPNIISNVLKLYLRQLPEPLLTFRLYSDFIHLAKENMAGYLVGDKMVEKLSGLVSKLPPSNFRTCAVLMHHLHRVAAHSDLNQMSSSNLGIVFGPTLLRPLEGTASLASLVDTPHQTRAIELLISNAEVVFGPGDDYQLVPDQTPVEALDNSAGELTITEPSPEKSPTKEINEVFAAPQPPTAAAAAGPSTTPSPVPPPGASSSSSQPDDKIPMVTDAGDSTPRLEPSAADFSLPGSASNDKYDNVFVDNASTSLADAPARTPEDSALFADSQLSSDSDDASLSTLDDDNNSDDVTEDLLPDQSHSTNSQSHTPLLTPHCIAETGGTVSESSTTKNALPPAAPKLTLAETAPAPDTTLQALQPVATLIDSSTWPGPASRTAVSIPASPTIVPRASSGSTGSDGRTSPTKSDPRSDRFKLEQRKLLSAIKSDPLVGITVGGEAATQDAGESKETGQEQNGGKIASSPVRASSLSSGLEKSVEGDQLMEKKTKKPGAEATENLKSAETKSSLKDRAESRVKRNDSGSKSSTTPDSPVRGVKLGTGVTSRMESLASRSGAGAAATRPSSTTAGRVRTSATAAIQRRGNITGVGSPGGGTSVASANTGSHSVLSRYPPATTVSTSSAAAARRSVGAQPSASGAQQRVSASSSQKQSSSSSPVRHSFESSLRSYGSSSPSLSTSEAATALAGNAARTRRISGERSHGSVRDMTAGAQTKTGLTSSPISSSARTFGLTRGTAGSVAKVGGTGATPKTAAAAGTGVSGVAATATGGSAARAGTSNAGTASAKTTPTASTGLSGVTSTSITTSGSVTKVGNTTVGTASKTTTAPNTGMSSVPTSTATTAAGQRLHEKCVDPKPGESDSQPQQSTPRDLSQDRTPRFV